METIHKTPEENIFFLNRPYTLDVYEDAMTKVVKSQDLQIGNQVRAAYMLATNNNLKTRIIDFAYSIFLFTFVVIGVIVMFTKLTT